MPLLIPEFSLAQSRILKMDLAFHCVAVHCNVAAFEYSGPDAIKKLIEFHWAEHFEPCGIRNHPYGSHAWDESKLEEVLEEAEKGDYEWTEGTLPNGDPRTYRWVINSAAGTRALGIGSH